MSSDNRVPLTQICQHLVMGLVLGWPASTWAQALVDTLPVAGQALAVNSATNKIYVTDCTSERSLVGGVLVAIDGATKLTTAIGVGLCPKAIAVNPVTNKIYVANIGESQGFGSFSGGSITIVDGATNSTMTVSDPHAPCAVAVNPATNKIYVTNLNSNDVTVIDGDTNSLTTIADPNAISPVAVAVNPITNKIYVANQGNSLYGSSNPGSVTVIDGETGSTITVSDPNANTPNSVAVNTSTDKIYIANTGSFVYSTGTNHGNVTVIDGATNSTATVTDPNALAPGGPDSRGFGLAVDTATNSIYVVNQRSNNVTLIDGATNSTTTIADPNAFAPVAVAVDPVTNRIYVANAGCSVTSIGCHNPGSVTVINGATKSAATIIDRKANAPEAVAVDAMTNQIYVLNEFSGNLSVIDGDGTATVHTLAVLLAGTGTGTVTSNPAGIDCGTSSCIASFAVGTPVSLSASAASGSQFRGFSGACQAGPVLFGPCDLTTNEDQFVTATFNSTGPVQVVVPNVVGQTQAAATASITSAGLVTGTVTQQSSSTVASGDVISQAPAAGTDAASGSAINLVVSSGGSSSGGSSSGGSSSGGSSSGGSGAGYGGGGGGLDSLALGALLAALMGRLKLRLQKRAVL